MTTYSCGRCGRIVSKSTRICPYCSAHLAGIRCKNCNFTGSESDFLGDRCPKCGSAVYTSKGGGADYPLGRSVIIGMFIASVILIIGSFALSIWINSEGVGTVGTVIGVILLVSTWREWKKRKDSSG